MSGIESKANLSPKQREVLNFIEEFSRQQGLPPTRGDIARGLRLKNRQGIDQHLRALAMKGAIELVPGISRGIRLLDAVPVLRADKPHDLNGLPLLGRIAAGSPILAEENIEEHVQVDAALFRPRADFLLRIHGDSMKDAHLLDRDLLVVHRTTQARNGEIVVARIGNEATVKFYRRQDNLIRLEPANSSYQPIEVDLNTQDFAIEGLAVGSIRTGSMRQR